MSDIPLYIPPPVRCVVQLLGADQSIPNGVQTTIGFDTAIVLDVASMWSIADPASIITPPGYNRVKIWSNVKIQSSALGTLRRRTFTINGNSQMPYEFFTVSEQAAPSAAFGGPEPHESPLIRVNPGDFIQVRINQDSGGPLLVQASALPTLMCTFSRA